MRSTSAALLAAIILAASVAEARQTITGKAYVRDIDTIVVANVPVRLNGVDGPELETSAGRQAAKWLKRYLAGKTVTCQLNGERTYDRWVGVCEVDGRDLGATVIANGLALDCARYSGGRYRHLETPKAKATIEVARFV